MAIYFLHAAADLILFAKTRTSYTIFFFGSGDETVQRR